VVWLIKAFDGRYLKSNEGDIKVKWTLIDVTASVVSQIRQYVLHIVSHVVNVKSVTNETCFTDVEH
jgi:hypothetical protein